MKVAVIGAGNGGQAISGYLALTGNEVSLYNRNEEVILELKAKGSITLKGCIEGESTPALFTSNIEEAIKDAELIMVTTTAVAHHELAHTMAPFLKDDQIIVLNPGRTGGALEFRNVLTDEGCSKRLYIAEAQTLVYACRIVSPGTVNIIGIKDSVYLSAYPSGDTDNVLRCLGQLYPCFRAAENILRTSLGLSLWLFLSQVSVFL